MTLILNGTDNSATTPAVTGTDTDTGVYYPAANQVALATSGTQAMLANASQGVQFANAIGVGATTPTTSGTGITFPATQSASSNANTLDDYEEGTWTPSIGGTATYTPATGTYTKIGKLVTFQMTLYVSSLGTGSQNTVSGLPFANVGSNGNMCGATMNYFGDLNVSVVYLGGYIPPSSSSILMVGTTAAAISIAPLNVIKTTTYLEMQGFYFVS
jgi:hypothetical protein